MQVTKKGLESLASRINVELNRPLTYFTSPDPKTRTINIGHYFLNWDYKKPQLVCTINERGGETVVIERCSKPEMYYRIWAFRHGIAEGQAHPVTQQNEIG